MPTYDFACPDCGAQFEEERPVQRVTDPAPCPVCGTAGKRLFMMPRLLFKADPRDNRPVWHKHDGYAHAHAPRKGRHRRPSEDH